MNFCWVTLHVSDMAKSLDFYQGLLGLKISSRHGGNGVEVVMLGEQDQPKVELLYVLGDDTERVSTGITIGFAVDSLKNAMEYLCSKQIPIIRGPIAPNPHTQFIFIHDPDGYEVQLVEMKSI